MNKNDTHPLLLCLLGLSLLFSSSPQALAQETFVLSKKADFSTNDRTFSRQDTLYIKVVAPQIDFTDIDENGWELDASNGDGKIEGVFINHLDGTYTAKVDLSTTDPEEVFWDVEIRIEDDSGNRFEVEVQIKIGDDIVGEQILIQGTIESLETESLIVNGITILVNDETVILDKDGLSIDYSELNLGERVMVLANREENGDLVARTIRLRGGIGENIEIRGVIQELTDSTLVLAGKEFDVDMNTEILDADGDPIQFSDLKVGFLVEVHAAVQNDGSLLATRIKIEDEDGEDEVEFTGTIEVLAENLIIVDGISFLVDGMTEILDDDNDPISFDDLEVGMLVQIRGEHDGTGILIATRIKIEDELDDDEVQLTGVVTAVQESAVVVSGVEFQVDDNTVILDEENNPIGLSDVRIGFVVEVRADVVDDVRVATEIKIEDRFENVIVITGVIEEIGEESLTVAALEFMITEETEIRDEDGQNITFQDLEKGMIVEVRAEIVDGGGIIATRIQVEDRFRGEVELVGTIDELGEGFLVLAGVRFEVGPNTDILDQDSNPIGFAQLNVGVLVEIKGQIQSNGQIVALRIQVKTRIEDEVKIVGVIEQNQEHAITVLDRTFGLTEHTAIFDAEGNTIGRSHLFVGQTAEVRGVLLPDGTLVAIRIQVQDDNATEINVVGPIDSFGANTVEVIGIHFFVDENTETLDADYNIVELTDLKVGQTVEVRAAGQPNGTRLATRIKVMDVVLLSSVVEEVVFNGIKMLDKQVLFDSSTLILGKLNQFWTVDDLESGHFVEVRAIRGPDNRLFGTKVKYLGGTSVTSVLPTPEDNNGLPNDFILHQNYPNPFNPTTTIRFEIPAVSGSEVPTKVTVYNLLGQEVNVLLDDELVAGTYTVQWNGRNSAGRQVPTGIYIYQLTTREVRQTKRMLLLR